MTPVFPGRDEYREFESTFLRYVFLPAEKFWYRGLRRRDCRRASATIPSGGTGITVFLQNGGALQAAQDMANHSDPRTTKLYDRRKDLATLSEIERRMAFE
jgi:hypothetical protein